MTSGRSCSPSAEPPGGYLGHRPIAAGTINTNLRVETAGGPRFLRINEGKSEDDVAREAAIVAARRRARRADARAGAARATGGPSRAGGARSSRCSPGCPGRTLARAEVTARARRARPGAALAALAPGQRRLRRSPPRPLRAGRDRSPPGADRRRRPPRARRRRSPRSAPELAALRALRRSDDLARLPGGLIHGDLFIDNVLYDDGRLVALLDFEQASWGRLAYDLAVTVLAFAFGRDDFRPEVVRALLDGYAAVRPPLPTSARASAPSCASPPAGSR